MTRGGVDQTKTTLYGTRDKEPALKDALIRFMVITDQAFSASPEDA